MVLQMMVPLNMSTESFSRAVSEYKNTYKMHTLLKITGVGFCFVGAQHLKVEGAYNTRLSSFYTSRGNYVRRDKY